MKIVFVSNFLSHHQQPMTEALAQQCDFTFVATTEVHADRLKLGWHSAGEPAYLCHYDAEPEKAEALLAAADVVIAGSAPEKLIAPCIRRKQWVLRYSERPLKNGIEWGKYLPRLLKWHIQNPPGAKVALLCASAYTAPDYARFGLFRGKAYRWGYFPAFKPFPDVNALWKEKEPASLLWAGRFLELKHPEHAITLMARLKDAGYNATVRFVGTGDREEALMTMAREAGVADRVEFLGSMTPEAVRSHMEKSQIFLFTSDRREGWGAVLNEAMNSGCCCVAARDAGASPYLIRHGENGLLYRSGDVDAMFREVTALLDDPQKCRKLGCAAYAAVAGEWNPAEAARRLLVLCGCLLSGDMSKLPQTGPGSPTEVRE